jgi:hypothetical protein
LVRSRQSLLHLATSAYTIAPFSRHRESGSIKVTTKVGQFRCKCPINFSLSRRYDKLKLIGHQTYPLPTTSVSCVATATLG